MDKDDAIKYADAIQLIINILLPFQIRDSICDFIYEEKELLDVTDLNGENYIPVNSKDTKKLVLSNIQKNILIEYVKKETISTKTQINFDLFIKDMISEVNDEVKNG